MSDGMDGMDMGTGMDMGPDMGMGMGSDTGMDMPTNMSLGMDASVPVPGSYYKGHYVPTMDEMMAYQNSRPETFDASVKYGYYALYFIAVTTFLAILVNFGFMWERRRRLAKSSGRAPRILLRKIVAIGRWLAYLRLPNAIDRWIAPFYTTGSFSQTILLGLGFVFCTGWTFGVSYYYRPPFYGSPPLALRSEWLAMAMLPFLFALAQKRNLIGTMSGTAYEKLQVLHQGVAGLHFYMSLVHTGAMAVRGAGELGINADITYTTGWIALGPLMWLCVASLPVFRSKAYEAFWFIHLIAVLAYLIALWFHVVDVLDGNAYMYATFAIFSYGFAVRMCWLLYRNLTLHTAHVTTSSTGALLLSIPTRMRWGPGQHAILRFLAVRPLESHPFTIALPARDGDTEHTMRFVVLPRTGFTGALTKKAAAAGGATSLRVLVDGPFGESGRSLRTYDSALLLAGGTGISHVLPAFVDLATHMKGEHSQRSLCRRVELVWVVRSIDVFEWFRTDIESALSGLPADQVSVRVMVTSATRGASKASQVSDESDSDEKGNLEGGVDKSIEILDGRPDLAALVRSRSREWDGRVAVTVCGPASFTSEASNAAATVQLDVVTGTTKCDELFLSSSLYHW